MTRFPIDINQLQLPITFESPMNESNTAFVANVAAKGIIPPVISLAKQAISGTQESSSAAVCQRRRTTNQS